MKSGPGNAGDVLSHTYMISADYNFLAGSREALLYVIKEATDSGGNMAWSEELEYALRGQDGEPQTLRFEHKDKGYSIP